MLTLKNPFSKTPPATPPGLSENGSLTDAEKAKKRWQLEQGRTRKRVEELRDQVEAARRALSQHERKLGEMMVDELDVTTDTAEMQHAGDRVRILESALVVAKEKDATAQAELTNAERLVAEETKDAARERVLALTQEGEELFTHLKRYRSHLARETAALCIAGGIEPYAEREILAQFDFNITIANRPPALDMADSGAFRKYKNFTDCLEKVCGKAQP